VQALLLLAETLNTRHPHHLFACPAAAAAAVHTWNIGVLRLNRSRTLPAALSVFKRSGDITSWGACSWWWWSSSALYEPSLATAAAAAVWSAPPLRLLLLL
jgi:hypothetical protein